MERWIKNTIKEKSNNKVNRLSEKLKLLPERG